MTSILLRLEPELLDAIDGLRGEVPRAAYIRNRLAETVRAVGVTVPRVPEPPRRIPPDKAPVRTSWDGSPIERSFAPRQKTDRAGKAKP